MPENEKTVDTLAAENEKLRRAVIKIKIHMEQIEEILEDLGELCEEAGPDDGESAAATDDEIKDLLKKYSRLG